MARAPHDRRAPRRVVAGRGRGDHGAARRPEGGGRRRAGRAGAPRRLGRRGPRPRSSDPATAAAVERVLRRRARRARRASAPTVPTVAATEALLRALRRPRTLSRPTTSTPIRAGSRSADVSRGAVTASARRQPPDRRRARPTRAARTLGLLDPVPARRPGAPGVGAHVAVVLGPRAHRPLRGALAAPRSSTGARAHRPAVRRRLRRVQAPAARARVARRSSTPPVRAASSRAVRERTLAVLDGFDADAWRPTPATRCSPTASCTAWSCSTSTSTTRRCSPPSSSWTTSRIPTPTVGAGVATTTPSACRPTCSSPAARS